MTIEVYYAVYVDSTQPSQTKTSNWFTVTVEEACPIDSFKNNAAISTNSEHYYKIYDTASSFDFQMPYEPQECNYIQDYTITIDGVQQTPSQPWISIDKTSNSLIPKVQVYSSTIADKGFYTISITSHLNTTPKYVSEDSYTFVVTIDDDPCSQI